MRSWIGTVVFCLAAGGAVAAPCPSIDGLDPLIEPGRILLLGEIHGTVESPGFVLDVACHTVRAGLPLVVGLELDASEQDRVNVYLQSDGSPADRVATALGPGKITDGLRAGLTWASRRRTMAVVPWNP